MFDEETLMGIDEVIEEEADDARMRRKGRENGDFRLEGLDLSQ